eukprot:TRINITY_DN1869_c0_g1_i1.p1 TRINITY_DN1869_c0_g1~~TRINITY_DN1869_c0_g1_i1.p1  ORF type:complete len:309 (+),score=11.52 TRINITY_DN1869_c0_g1_i1:28-954(+)
MLLQDGMFRKNPRRLPVRAPGMSPWGVPLWARSGSRRDLESNDGTGQMVGIGVGGDWKNRPVEDMPAGTVEEDKPARAKALQAHSPSTPKRVPTVLSSTVHIRLINVYNGFRREHLPLKEELIRIIRRKNVPRHIDADVSIKLGSNSDEASWVRWYVSFAETHKKTFNALHLLSWMEDRIAEVCESVTFTSSVSSQGLDDPPIFSELKKLRSEKQPSWVSCAEVFQLSSPLIEVHPPQEKLISPLSEHTPVAGCHCPFSSGANWFEDALVAELDIRVEDSVYTMSISPDGESSHYNMMDTPKSAFQHS